MQYFLILLPPEIVNIIYNFNLKDKAASSIVRFYKTRYQYNSNMKYLIRYTLSMEMILVLIILKVYNFL